MNPSDVPRVDARYWTAITLASVCGTNLGDLYAHESRLGIVKGLALLALLASLVFLVERISQFRTEAYYWAVIVLIRTGATNIADYLAYRVRVPGGILSLTLGVLLATFAWGTVRSSSTANSAGLALPKTDALYWLTMLLAGVFGTVVGDICEHPLGEGMASCALLALLLAVLVFERARAAKVAAAYWITIALARTTGTALGDWLAEDEALALGLKVATLMSAAALLAVLLLWKSRNLAARE